MLLRELLTEKWSTKYKKGINCSNPKGFSQKAHCAGRKARQSGENTSSSSVSEALDSQVDFVDMMGKFLPICMKELNLKKLPKIKLVKFVNDQDQPTFGRFENEKVLITLGLAGRHPLDVLRTLAHELVHFKQLTKNELNHNSGETGSPEENEANAIAGVIMRHWNKAHPQYFHEKPILSEYASAGSTSSGNIAVGAIYKNKKGKSLKNPNGTVKNALDATDNLLTGGSIKR
jgi:hypothetical protein